MLTAHHPRLLALAVAAAAVLPVLVVPTAARAEEIPPTTHERPQPGDTVVGELVQGYADPFPTTDPGAGHDDADDLVSWIRTGAGEAVRVPSEDVEDIETGSVLEVTVGGTVDDQPAAADLEPAHDVLAAEVLAAPDAPTAPLSGPVNHPVTVVMLQPAGSVRDGTTLAQVVAAVNGPVADFWDRQTGGAVRFGVVAAHDWTTPSAISCSDPIGLWEEAATRARWTEAPGRHLLVHVPADSPGCSYGLGTIGSGTGSGGLSYAQAPELSVLAHELGHNMGLGHAAQLYCDSAPDSGTCAVDGYGDWYDVMGIAWGPVGSLNAPHAALLGVLPAGSAPTVAVGAAPTQYTLAPVGSRTGTRAVRLVDSDGDVYWVEYRTPTGQDSWLGTPDNWPDLQSGVQVRLSGPGDETSLLLDGTPSPASGWGSDWHVALPALQPVTFGSAPFTVTVLEAGPSAARVDVATTLADRPSAIEIRYLATGGVSGPLGAPTGPEVCGLLAGGCRRSYAHGSLYWDPQTARVSRLGVPVTARYEAAGGPWALGYPRGDETATPAPLSGGRIASFPGGDVVWSAATGAHVLRGGLLLRWRQLQGVLGFPVGSNTAVAGGSKVDFTGGSLFWSQATGVRMVRGSILRRYVAAGGPAALGFPVADDGATADRTGALVRLQRGAVYWSSRTGAHVVAGGILTRWQQLGGHAGVLGYPVGGNTAVAGGSKVDFTGGSLFWSQATGVRMVRGSILRRYVAAGGPGVLGFPVADDGRTSDGTGALVRLQRGAIYWSQPTGAHAVTGAILDRWRSLGAHTGSLGYPVSGPTPLGDGTGVESRFQGGRIVARTDGRVEVLTG